MGNILSSSTIYGVAFLTDLGRKYLFDPINNNRFTLTTDSNNNNVTIDAFKIVYFSMSDPDYNYNITYGNSFETGEIANISGKNEDCIKGTIIHEENNLISVNGKVNGVNGLTGNDNLTVDVPYILETNIAGNILNINLNSFPTFVETTSNINSTTSV
jgi:hypothetical protein